MCSDDVEGSNVYHHPASIVGSDPETGQGCKPFWILKHDTFIGRS
jgi:hypothetical protein